MFLTFIISNDIINSTNAATKIDGPEGEFNSRDAKRPTITDNTPPNIENKTICFGLLDKFLAIAAGISSKPVIRRTPIILIDIAITPARSRVKIRLAI